jgi:hypothetical protein
LEVEEGAVLVGDVLFGVVIVFMGEGLEAVVDDVADYFGFRGVFEDYLRKG